MEATDWNTVALLTSSDSSDSESPSQPSLQKPWLCFRREGSTPDLHLTYTSPRNRVSEPFLVSLPFSLKISNLWKRCKKRTKDFHLILNSDFPIVSILPHLVLSLQTVFEPPESKLHT